MSRNNILIGIDIGSSLIRTVISQKQGGESKPLILGVGIAPSLGVNNGVIVDIEETISAINKSKELAEQTSGVPVEHAFISINGSHLSSQPSKGVVAVSRADGEISEEDIARVINASQAISMPSNKEIIAVIPCNYIIDEQDQIKDPMGMNGVRLEVSSLVIEGMAPFIKNLSKCVQRAGIDIDDLVFSPLAAAKSVLTKRQKELGVVVIDIGKGTTGVSVYEDGNILHSVVIPVGSGHITNDIAIGLRTSIDLAEKIKLEYGTVKSKELAKKDKIDISKIDSNEEGIFTRKYLAEIIEARVEEIFFIVDKELKKIDKSGMLPAGSVLTGGGAKMQGMVSMAKEKLRLPSQIGIPTELNGIIDKVDDPSFATVIGLIMWETDENGVFIQQDSGLKMPHLRDILQKVRGAFKTFLP